MTKNDIIVLVLTSSLISSLLTVFFQWIFKFIDFKNDFNKKIIDKRLNAYEKIENTIWSLSLKTQDGNKAWLTILSSSEYYNNFTVNLVFNIKQSIWISNELNSKLTELNVFLTNLENKYMPKKDSDFETIGEKHMTDITLLRDEIKYIYFKDFNKIHDVSSFLKDKGESKKTFQVLKQKSKDSYTN
tara:strand:+ start:35 stop:595 length:561 start_codon:yes stop_codon:yes gene_type:complete